MDLWQLSVWAAWIISAAIFIYLIFDFFKVNLKYSETVLTSSREGVDELFRTKPRRGNRSWPMSQRRRPRRPNPTSTS
ncbi:MAG: hypothetical protein WDM92_06565 [Caulobacteraceae bacterium]